MQEIQVGEYVRTKNGYIRKIIEDFSTDNSYFKLDKEKLTKYEFTYFYSDEIFKKEIKNHSFNIIDLIEEGDFINSVLVTQSYLDNIKYLAKEIVKNNYGIKSIVTKEQFDSIKYEV